MAKKPGGVDIGESGYRKPPKRTQWRKGQSGNPKGRKQGTRNFKTEVKELLNSMVSVVRDGKPAKMSAQRAALERLFDKALNGDIRALTQLIRLAQEQSDAGPSSVERSSANDRQILDIYKSRVLNGAAGMYGTTPGQAPVTDSDRKDAEKPEGERT
jgi:hypothetical protein